MTELYDGDEWHKSIKANTLTIRTRGVEEDIWYFGRCDWCGFSTGGDELDVVKRDLIAHLSPMNGYGWMCNH